MMRVVIEGKLPQIGRAMQLVDEFRKHHGLAERDANAVSVVLDEILSNSIRYGLADAGKHQISVTLDYAGNEITVEIEDDGIAYDPTQAPAPVLAGTLMERKPGGLGIAFVRAFTDSIEYRRVSERNHLTLRRRVVREGAA